MSYERKQAQRRSMAIRAYVGRNGSGKTWTAVNDLVPDMKAGRTILSTTQLFDPWEGGPYRGYVPLVSWRQFLDAEDCVILLDEIAGVADSRHWQSVPAQMGLMLQQLRKRNIVLVWTGIRYALADSNLRRLTWGVIECKSYLPTRAATGGPWKSNRVILASLFDAADFDSFDQEKLQPGAASSAHKRPRLLHRSFVWRSKHLADRAYSTKESTLALDTAESGGLCVYCSGRRKVRYCSCEPVEEVHEVHDLISSEPVPTDGGSVPAGVAAAVGDVEGGPVAAGPPEPLTGGSGPVEVASTPRGPDAPRVRLVGGPS